MANVWIVIHKKSWGSLIIFKSVEGPETKTFESHFLHVAVSKLWCTPDSHGRPEKIQFLPTPKFLRLQVREGLRDFSSSKFTGDTKTTGLVTTL